MKLKFLKKRLQWLLLWLTPWLGAGYAYLVGWTSRMEIIDCGGGQPVSWRKNALYAVWHSRVFFFPYYGRGTGTIAMVSRSKDGEGMARFLHLMGMRTVRGSSKRGGQEAFDQMAQLLRQGERAFITPDGPRGPRQQLKPGVIHLAQQTGVMIIPLVYSTTRGHFFHSWDRFLLPFPFGHIKILTGEPMHLAPTLAPEEYTARHARLENHLNDLLAEADRLCGRDLQQGEAES